MSGRNTGSSSSRPCPLIAAYAAFGRSGATAPKTGTWRSTASSDERDGSHDSRGTRTLWL